MNIKIIVLSFPKQDEYEQLTNVLEPLNNQEYNDFHIFWKDWYSGKITGDKITIVAINEHKIV